MKHSASSYWGLAAREVAKTDGRVTRATPTVATSRWPKDGQKTDGGRRLSNNRTKNTWQRRQLIGRMDSGTAAVDNKLKLKNS